MSGNTVTVQCMLTGKHFRDYALFDTFVRKKRWQSPAIFAGILCAFALVCFAAHERDGAVVLGTILALVGLILPAGYVGNYLLNLHLQTRKMRVTHLTVRADSAGITLIRDEREQTWAWSKLFCAYRTAGMICVYPNEQQAFLAAGDPEELDALWARIAAKMPADRVTDRRR